MPSTTKPLVNLSLSATYSPHDPDRYGLWLHLLVGYWCALPWKNFLLAPCGTLHPTWISAAMRERCSINDIRRGWGSPSKIQFCRKLFCCPGFKRQDLKLWGEDALYFPRPDCMKGHSSAPPSTDSDYTCRFYDSYCTARGTAHRNTVVHEVLKKTNPNPKKLKSESKEKTNTKDRLYKISCLNLILIGQVTENIWPHNKPVN